MNYYLLSLTIFLFNIHNTIAIEDNQSLEEIFNIKVSISSRFDEKIDVTPSTVTVFTNKEIKRLGFKTLSDLLGHIPSFSIIELGDRKTMTVRGSRSLSQVLLIIDGERANNSIIGGFYVFNNDIILSNVEKVEIIRGPGAAM